jgi:hypothetical protein
MQSFYLPIGAASYILRFCTTILDGVFGIGDICSVEQFLNGYSEPLR